MTSYEREFHIRAESVNPETGEFEATLFSDGEASDGHILNMAGGSADSRLPLFVNHRADPVEQLGSLFPMPKTEHEFPVRGQIELEGHGAALEIRKDLLVKMRKGHVSRFSGRWDAEQRHIKRRVNLPRDHPAFVDEKKADGRKQFGLYFEKWRALEGSVVGLGADPSAVLRWVKDEQSPEPVRQFWARQLEELPIEPDVQRTESQRPDPSDFESKEDFLKACIPQVINEGKTQEQAVAQCNSMWENRKSTEGFQSTTQDMPRGERMATSDPRQEEDAMQPIEQVSPEAQRAAFAAYIRQLQAEGAALEDLHEEFNQIIQDHTDGEDLNAVILSKLTALVNRQEEIFTRLAKLEEGQGHNAAIAPNDPSIKQDEIQEDLHRRDKVEEAERAFAEAGATLRKLIKTKNLEKGLENLVLRTAPDPAAQVAKEIRHIILEERVLRHEMLKKLLNRVRGRVSDV